MFDTRLYLVSLSDGKTAQMCMLMQWLDTTMLPLR